MRSQALMAFLLSTACIEVEQEQDSGECEAPMAPYDAASPDLTREPQTLGVHAAPIVDTFEHELHVAPWGLDGASGTLDDPLATMAGARSAWCDRFEMAKDTLRSGFMRDVPHLRNGCSWPRRQRL